MKKGIVTLISLYQIILSPILRQFIGVNNICRYNTTCSEYAKIVISKYGIVPGIKLALVRLMHCQPFSHSYETV